MGFTNVAWESRAAEKLARDLTNGPGPMSVGQAGAAWVRVADEWASMAREYDNIIETIQASFTGRGADAMAHKLVEFGQWLQSVSVAAATNGQRAEEAAVAYSVAVLAMPSVSEAIEARTGRDVMASLAAYNGAILNGQFAEFDEAVSAHQATASAVMYQYEQACDAMAAPWQQPITPDVCSGAALKTERDAEAAGERGGRDAGAGGAAAGVPPAPLAAFRPAEVKSSSNPKEKQSDSLVSASSGGAMGSGYGPMAALARGASAREHHSFLAATVDGGGERGTGLSQSEPSWLPATSQNDAPLLVSQVSWGPNTSLFDELAEPVEPEVPQYDDAPNPTLEQVSDRWVSPAVIGIDKGLRL